MTVAVRSAGGPFRRVRTTVGALDRWDAAALLGAAVLVMLVFFTFRQYGISNDEEVQNVYGKRLLSFYLSGFADNSAFTYKNLYLYGGLFDMAAVALEAVLPFDPYDTRHLLSGLIGVLGIAGVWLLARRLATPRAAVLAGLLLALTGPWYGGMFNHTKDVPFAAGMVWALYFLCRIIEELPRPQPGRVLVFGVAVGLSLGLRVGGVFSGFYAFLAVLAWSLFVGPQASWRARLAQGALAMRRLIPAAVVAYALMAAFWPWSVFDPLNPIRALSEFSAFQYDVRTIFAGTVYKMYEVPRSYVPVYLAIKLPLAMLVGASAFAWLGIRTGRGCAACRLGLSLTAFAVVFPIAVFVLTDMPAYNGLRHLLFVVPPLAVLAGIGLDNLLVRVRSRRLLAGAVTGALTLHLGSVEVTLALMHPHQYVYYNELVGGLRGASRGFELDYWVNILPEAVEDLTRQLAVEAAANHEQQRTYTVAVCGDHLSFEAIAPPYLTWTADWLAADFFIAPTHMACDRALKGNPIHTVERLGVVLGVVKDRRHLKGADRELVPEHAR